MLDVRRSVLRVVVKRIAFLLLTGSHVHGAEVEGASPLLLTHTNIVNVNTGKIASDQSVLIREGKIVSVMPSMDSKGKSDDIVLDIQGRFLIPGLWDMHVHDDTASHTEQIYFPLFIANGVTGIRDMFSQCADPCPTPELFPDLRAIRRRVEDRILLGPHIIISSPLLDGPKSAWPGAAHIATPKDATRAVDTAAQKGADFIKVYNGLPRNAYFVVAAESKKLGIPFAGHVPYSVTLVEASDAGQRSVEHLMGMEQACTTASACEKVAIHLSQNGTWQTPTLVVSRFFACPQIVANRNDPRLTYIWSEQKKSWDQTPPADAAASTCEANYQRLESFVRTLHAAHAKFLVGTDLGNPYIFPGFSVHDEMALLVNAGLTPLEALQAATINPARYLDGEATAGTVAPGRSADLVVLDENPLADIRNISRINSVVVRGQLFDRAALDKMLEGARAAALQ
jgi:imidazolonepropionase-like amidohydrolase